MSTARGTLPDKIGHYKIVSELGRGGMGVVYKAHEESLNRFVAIKVLGDHLAADEQFLSRFTREARAAGGVAHPNVIPIYFIGDDDGQHYFAMEYVSGRSVQAMIKSEGRVDNPRAAQIILQAAHGLAAAHDKGVIHRDIKPANLMVDERGVVKIADFGIALPVEAQTRLTATGALMGTPGYLSPEQCMGETVDHRADIYALGVTYYEMLTGRMPFNAESPLALLRQILQEDPPDVNQLNKDVDPASRQILMKMIARNRDERYQSCHELIGALEDYLATRNVRSVTANLASRSTAAPGAASTPTVMTAGAATGSAATALVSDSSQAKTMISSAAGATAPTLGAVGTPTLKPVGAAAVTAPGNAPFVKPATNPGQAVSYAPPQPAAQKKSSFALVAAFAIIAVVIAAGAAGLIGYKLVKGQKVFGFGRQTQAASVLPVASNTQPSQVTQTAKPVSQNAVELANTNPTALTALTSTQTPVDTQSSSVQPPSTGNSQQGSTGNSQQASTVVPSSNGSATTRQSQQSGAIETAKQAEHAVAHQVRAVAGQVRAVAGQVRATTVAVARPSTIVFAVQGDQGLTGAVSDVLSSELASSGLKVVDSDDLPETEGMRGGSAAAYLDRLRGTAGFLVLAKVEPTGQRELHYMGRYDTANGARVTVTVFDVATGRPIGTRGSANLEYTQLNAAREAEKAVAPLAQKAVEAIQNH